MGLKFNPLTGQFDFVIPGPQGPQGLKGDTGATGAPGPNTVSTSTSTNITGLLKGNGANVAQAISGTDFEAAGTTSSHISAGLHTTLKLSQNTVNTTGNIDDLVSDKGSVVLNGQADTVIRGIAAGTETQFLWIVNNTGRALVIKNQDSNPTAANRIITANESDTTFSTNSVLGLQYTGSRWHVVSGAGLQSTWGMHSKLDMTDVDYYPSLTSEMSQQWEIAGDTGPVDAYLDIFAMSQYPNGMTVRLIGTSDDNPVTVFYGDAPGGLLAPFDIEHKRGIVSEWTYFTDLDVWVMTFTNLQVPAETEQSFETVSKNLKSYPYALNYTDGVLTSIVYNLGGGQAITKTLNYTNGTLTSVVLSGDTPSGISLTKTLSYTGGNLTGVSYA